MTKNKDINSTFKFFLISRAMRSVSLVFVTLALPLYLFILHYNVISIGIIYLVIISFNALLSVFLGALGDRLGYKKSLIIGEIFPIIALIMLSSSTNFFIIVIAAVLGGITGVAGGMRGVFSPGSTALIVSNWKDQKERVKRLAETSYVGSAFAIGGSMLLYAIGFISGYVGSIGSFRIFFAISALLIIISMISLLFVEEVRRPKKTTRIMKKSSAKYSIKIIVANLFNGFGLGIALPLLPLWFELRFGVSISNISILYTVSYAATAIASYLAAKRAYHSRFSTLFTASYTRTLQGVMLIVMAFSPLFILSIFFFTIRSFIAGFGSPSRSAVNMNGVNSQDYGTASSIMGLSNRLSQTSSGLSGYMMDVYLPFPVLMGGILQTFGGFIYYKVLLPRKKRSYK
ncbi:MAG: major facilitator superfamily MFS_1 [Candidatus Parvarchaeum acidophilus ARMAN-5]|jgi:MFS family permease|uniref:Major facilitator superfamily MFS_1 n=1 Tax=Candidatus Parvarchaeum acidophilus ARMAN-5 TaxID=662762 RepID=D6GUP6_PARA5|nr:MAG: major facilitator superfamily MFS_1 [Candidatus Parvarchaeum acidophilus ARMAN-5]